MVSTQSSAEQPMYGHMSAATIQRSRWQSGQKCDERFMNGTRRIGVPQR